jgi:hypothetical protein
MSLANPYYVGLQNVGSYQVSGIPYVTGATAPVSSSTPVKITFPTVTQRITVENTGPQDVRIGFSSLGVSNTDNFYIIHGHNSALASDYSHIDMKVKVSSIFVLSNATTASTVRIMAELTNIDSNLLVNSGPSGSNWSGSVGVG